MILYPIVKSLDAMIVNTIAKIIEIDNDIMYGESDIPKQVYHRLIKGDSNLVVEIVEL